MNKDKIYPTMVIRSQAEAIELLEKENKQLKDNWNKLKNILDFEIVSRTLYSDKKRFVDIDEILLKMQELEKVLMVIYRGM